MRISIGLVFAPRDDKARLEAVQWIEEKMLSSLVTEIGLLVEDGIRVAVWCFKKVGAAITGHGPESIFNRIKGNHQLVIVCDHGLLIYHDC